MPKDHSALITQLLNDPETAAAPTIDQVLANPSLIPLMTIAQLEAFVVTTCNDGPLSLPTSYRSPVAAYRGHLVRYAETILMRLLDDPKSYERAPPRVTSLNTWTRHDLTVLGEVDLTHEEMHGVVTTEMPDLNPARLHTYCPADCKVIWQRVEALYLGRELRCEKIRMRRGMAGGFKTIKVWYNCGASQKTKEVYDGTMGMVLKQSGCPNGRLQFAPTTLCGCVNGSQYDTDPDEVVMRSMCCSHGGGLLMALREWQRREASALANKSRDEWLLNVCTYREESAASADTKWWGSVFFDPMHQHLRKLVGDAVDAGELDPAVAKASLKHVNKAGEESSESDDEEAEETVSLRRIRKLGRVGVDPMQVDHYPRRNHPEEPAPKWQSSGVPSDEWRALMRALFDRTVPNSLCAPALRGAAASPKTAGVGQTAHRRRPRVAPAPPPPPQPSSPPRPPRQAPPAASPPAAASPLLVGRTRRAAGSPTVAPGSLERANPRGRARTGVVTPAAPARRLDIQPDTVF